MTNLHLWHSDKNFTELAETPYPESSGVIYNLYEDSIVQREEIERLNARVKELERIMYSVALGIAREVGADNIDAFQYERLYSLIQELKKGAKHD